MGNIQKPHLNDGINVKYPGPEICVSCLLVSQNFSEKRKKLLLHSHQRIKIQWQLLIKHISDQS